MLYPLSYEGGRRTGILVGGPDDPRAEEPTVVRLLVTALRTLPAGAP